MEGKRKRRSNISSPATPTVSSSSSTTPTRKTTESHRASTGVPSGKRKLTTSEEERSPAKRGRKSATVKPGKMGAQSISFLCWSQSGIHKPRGGTDTPCSLFWAQQCRQECKMWTQTPVRAPGEIEVFKQTENGWNFLDFYPLPCPASWGTLFPLSCAFSSCLHLPSPPVHPFSVSPNHCEKKKIQSVYLLVVISQLSSCCDPDLAVVAFVDRGKVPSLLDRALSD